MQRRELWAGGDVNSLTANFCCCFQRPTQSEHSFECRKQGAPRAATRFLNVALKVTHALLWCRALGSAEDTGQRAVGVDARDMVDGNTVICREGATNVEVSRAVWQRDDG